MICKAVLAIVAGAVIVVTGGTQPPGGGIQQARPTPNAGRVAMTEDGPASDPMPELSIGLHDWYAQNAVALNAPKVSDTEPERAALESYMVQAGCSSSLVALAGVMVEEAHEHGIDSRICPVTAVAESSGGHTSDVYGAGWSADFETQTRNYFYQVIKNCNQTGIHPMDVWTVAWYWYGGGSSKGGKSESYADNVLNSVQQIGW